MSKIQNHYCCLAIGKTQESTETTKGFKKYIGVGAVKILAYNPTKEKLDEIMGYTSSYEPVYTEEKDGEKVAHVHFIVETDPNLCNNIDIKSKAMFTLKNKPALSSNGTKVQVIDDYGNYAKVNYEDAKAHKALPSNYKIDQNHYRIACEGEVNLVVFLKKFLCVPSSLDYVNGTWIVKSDASKTALFKLERIKDFFKGDFSEIQEALNEQPTNHVKLLYGIRTKEDGTQVQAICTEADFIIRNDANETTISKVATALAKAKNAGKYSNIDYRIQELQEYTVEPTNLDAPTSVEENSPFPPEQPSESDDFRWGED